MNIYLIRRTDSNKDEYNGDKLCIDPYVAAVVVAESELDARHTFPSKRRYYCWVEHPDGAEHGMHWANEVHTPSPGEWTHPDNVEVILLGRDCVNEKGVVLGLEYYDVHGVIEFAEDAPSYPGLDPV